MITPIDSGIQPYPGLRAYEADENHLFFGRDEQSDELLRRLRLNRFLAVVGTSGSGKSSLVRAGLLPSLYGGFMAKAGSVWRIATMRPGADPIGNLAAALYTPEVFGSDADAESGGTSSLFAETTLRRGPLGLVEVTRYGHLAADENLLILVDQFEEIFRFARAGGADNKDDSAGFVKLLLEAARQNEIPIYVILTMRSDFLGDCARFRSLPEAINDGQYLVPRLTRDQLREAIVGPAAVGGAEVAHRLVQRLLGEVGDDPDQLPILQHALMRTWDIWTERGSSGPLDTADYEATGGMSSALSRHADEAYQELGDDRRREIARVLFQRLSEKSEDHREIRRPTRLDEICGVVNAGADEVAGVIEVFRRPGRSFLMPPVDVPLTAQSAIDISHESLMRVWTRLKNWVDEEAESAAQYRRLAQSAALEAKGEAGPMTDPELSITLDWRSKWRPNAAWAERYHPDFAVADAFLERSREVRDVAVRAGEERRRREMRRTRGFAAILGLACLIVTAFLVFALRQRAQTEVARREAEKAAIQAGIEKDKAGAAEIEAKIAQGVASEEKDKAEKSAEQARSEREVALARKSAAQSTTSHDSQFDLALLLSVKALDLLGPKEFENNLSGGLKSDIGSSSFFKEHAIQEAKSALLQTLQSRPQLNAYLHGHAAAVNCVAYNRDGKMLASGSDDGSIILWDASAHKQIDRLTGHLGRVTSVSFSPDGKTLVSGSTDRTAILWDLTSRPKRGAPLTGHAAVESVSFAADGRMLATGGTDGTVILWNVASRRQIGPPLPGGVGAIQRVAFSPDGSMLGMSGSVKTSIWDVRTTPPQPVDKAPPNSSQRFAFSPDSKTIAVSVEETIVLFDIVSHKPLKTLPAPRVRLESLAFSPDGGSLAAGFSDNAVVVYNVGDPGSTEAKTLAGHRGRVASIAFNPSGLELASASGDGDLILWNPRASSRIARTLTGVSGGEVGLVSFSPDGKVLVSGNSDGTVSFWDVATGEQAGKTVACQSKMVASLAFSPDGKILASGCEDQTVVLLNVGSRRRLGEPLRGHQGSVSYVGFSRDGRSLISSSQDTDTRAQPRHTAFVWDVPSRTRRGDGFSLPPDKAPVFAPDGGLLAFGEGEKVVLRATTSNGGIGQPKELKKDKYQVSRLVFSPDGKILASHTRFRHKVMSESWLESKPAILLWNTEIRQEPGALRDYGFSGVMSFSPNAKLLAAAAEEGISLWDVTSQKQVGALMEGNAEGLIFSPDGRTLAAIQDNEIPGSGIQGKGITLWDVATGEPLGRLPTGDVSSFSFSPDGNKLLASSPGESRAFTLWDLNVSSWKARACAVANRNFTRDEWEYQFGQKLLPYSAVCPTSPDSVAVASIEALTQAAVHEGENLVLSGKVAEAAAAFMRVLKFRPASAIASVKWNNLCWVGSLNRQVDAQVMKACEFAVALDPSEIGNIDTRGVARAVAGDFKGAIQDFQRFLAEWKGDSIHSQIAERMREQRREWITVLRAGKDPFTTDVLMELRKQ